MSFQTDKLIYKRANKKLPTTPHKIYAIFRKKL